MSVFVSRQEVTKDLHESLLRRVSVSRAIDYSRADGDTLPTSRRPAKVVAKHPITGEAEIVGEVFNSWQAESWLVRYADVCVVCGCEK